VALRPEPLLNYLVDRINRVVQLPEVRTAKLPTPKLSVMVLVKFERLSGLWNYRFSRPTGTLFTFFFKIQKKTWLFTFFWVASHVFSNTDVGPAMMVEAVSEWVSDWVGFYVPLDTVYYIRHFGYVSRTYVPLCTSVAWWRNGYCVRLAIKRSRVRLLTGSLPDNESGQVVCTCICVPIHGPLDPLALDANGSRGPWPITPSSIIWY